MERFNQQSALQCAAAAAQRAGELLRRNLRKAKSINLTTQHDLKIELDVRCQRLIERSLRTEFPKIQFLGEEGVAGNPSSNRRWVVDPIDGTVNFAYGIPHACVSIALQERRRETGEWKTTIGVVLDPFCREIWTAIRGRLALMNGSRIKVSGRTRLRETIVSLGFGKQHHVMRRMLPGLNWLIPRARKVRIMGAAALGLSYVACGRFDAYVESGLQLWDIAAGGLIIECAGGEFWRRKQKGSESYDIIASNGLLRTKLSHLMVTER